MDNRYLRFLAGLKLLEPYATGFELWPVPNSFPNGAPKASSSAICVVNCDADKIWIDVWKRKFDIFALKELGWKSESEDTIWTFE